MVVRVFEVELVRFVVTDSMSLVLAVLASFVGAFLRSLLFVLSESLQKSFSLASESSDSNTFEMFERFGFL